MISMRKANIPVITNFKELEWSPSSVGGLIVYMIIQERFVA